jgi:hypothetical protein
MKTYGGVEIIAQCFLVLGTGQKWVVSFVALPLYPQERLHRELDDLHN